MLKSKENEILLITQEECAEVTQAISKIFRFGLSAKHPERTFNNRHHLEEELGDLACMISLMVESGLVQESNIQLAAERKRMKLEKWSSIFKDK